MPGETDYGKIGQFHGCFYRPAISHLPKPWQPTSRQNRPARQALESHPKNLAVTALSPKQAVSIALKAMETKQANHEIAQALVVAGADPSDAPTIIESIRVGFKSGVQSKVMGTRVHPNGDHYYLEAFAQGRFAMRFTSPVWVLIRMIAPFVIRGLILAFLVWRFIL